jgi:Tfp pilus assembly PilM family ATPase
MAKKLGIYFGIKGIDIILGQGKSILTSINIPQEKFSPSDEEEKISQDVKIVALIKDELRKQKVEAKDAAIVLSGRDLIIRSFELPSALPRDELVGAISFEVKKYLPFKVEDLVSDFQSKLYKKEKRNLILFFGIKTKTMKTYLSIMDQLDLRVTDFEYSAFSILRLMNLLNIKTKGVVAFMSLDLEDESNFMVLEDGFPLFSRDI